MRIVAVAIVLLWTCVPALANWSDTPLVDDTEAAACNVLKKHMAKLMGRPSGKPDPLWFCVGTTMTNDFLRILQLRWDSRANGHDLGVDPLIGTFAVAKAQHGCFGA
jgi:hypothetical protein